MQREELSQLILNTAISDDLKAISDKVFNLERITEEEGVLLYEKGELNFLGVLANYVRNHKHGDNTFFNRNIHVEPTNICKYNCKFCSYSRRKGEEGSWELTDKQIIDKIQTYPVGSITEVHIVGGVHPDKNLHDYGKLLSAIKEVRPELHLKAFTAVELEYMIKKAGFYLREGLERLKDYGLDSLPGGGAEIFDEAIRKEICGTKSKSETWLRIHEKAHEVGLQSNATMLYGHVEKYSHRIDHLSRLRKLQDKTGGFNAFIPLKYKSTNNDMSTVGETTTIDDLKNYAVSRIFLDNIDHVKAYWPMIGKDVAIMSLSYGVDDLDGTIDDSTKIYSMAGAKEQNPAMSTDEIVSLIKAAKRKPIERDSLYNIIEQF